MAGPINREIRDSPQTSVVPDVNRGELHLLSIGIGRYVHCRPLQTAARGAREVAPGLAEQNGLGFQRAGMKLAPIEGHPLRGRPGPGWLGTISIPLIPVVAATLTFLLVSFLSSCSQRPSGQGQSQGVLSLTNSLDAGPKAVVTEAWTNSLGMVFVPVPGTSVQFCIWETRLRDFRAFVEATGYEAGHEMIRLRSDGAQSWSGYDWTSPGFEQEATHPVVGVNWQDARAFCGWLTQTERASGKIGAEQRYRLPTVWEWLRAAGDTAYPWGDSWPPPAAAGNYAGAEARDVDWPAGWKTLAGSTDAYPRTAPVGSFKTNRSGLYDLGGNAREWCDNSYVLDLKGKTGCGASEVLPELKDLQFGVLCGGSWMDGDSNAMACTSSLRCSPLERSCATGFRVVLEGPGQPGAAKDKLTGPSRHLVGSPLAPPTAPLPVRQMN